MIPGRATPEGTAAFAKKHARLHESHWRPALGLTLSSVGMGTYLGNADPVTDGKYAAAAKKALEVGINVFDSAINYRYQRSERAIGAALKAAVEGGAARREEVLLSTKGGFIAGELEPETREWWEATFEKPGIATAADVVAGCHCMTPKYLKHQVDQSRKNLGVETIDVYYVHNPETQIEAVGPEEYYRRLTEAFRALEECAAEGKIQWYGTATWNAYRVPAAEASHASIGETVAAAIAAGGRNHRFRVVQLPFNFAFPEAYADATQGKTGEEVPALEAARAFELAVFSSVPLLQSRLLEHPALRRIRDRFPGLRTDAQRCLQFVRSTPGITAPLCGMKTVEHVEENAKVAEVPPIPPEDYESFFGGL
jgi:aryl-alcohol dehydrogenase-like predicted oxidoreductase